jgi:hypothetical protein
MSRTRALSGLVAFAGFVALAACSGDVEDQTLNLPSATLELTTSANLENVAAGQAIPIRVDITNITLVDPGVAPPPEHVFDAAYLAFTLDDESSTPLLVTSQTDVNVVIPPGTPEGHHAIICRVHMHDGTPTETSFELDITVRRTVSVSSLPDAGVSFDASTAITGPRPSPSPSPMIY